MAINDWLTHSDRRERAEAQQTDRLHYDAERAKAAAALAKDREALERLRDDGDYAGFCALRQWIHWKGRDVPKVAWPAPVAEIDDGERERTDASKVSSRDDADGF